MYSSSRVLFTFVPFSSTKQDSFTVVSYIIIRLHSHPWVSRHVVKTLISVHSHLVKLPCVDHCIDWRSVFHKSQEFSRNFTLIAPQICLLQSGNDVRNEITMPGGMMWRVDRGEQGIIRFACSVLLFILETSPQVAYVISLSTSSLLPRLD